MDEFQLLVDLHRDNDRQGPGGDEQTRRAIELSGLASRRGLKIADIGCGTGASTLVLARSLDAHITAVDFLPEFLERLDAAARETGLSDRITTLAQSMDALDFADDELDAIWAEGAIYSIGFEAGVRAWRRFLKPGGVLAVSEITWLTANPPAELREHWQGEYAEIAPASDKIACLEREGFTPVGYFPLPEHCWLDNYYRPLQARFAAFLEAHGHSPGAQAIVEDEKAEIALYERFSAFISYGFYIARKSEEWHLPQRALA
ncbi:MAG: methyltransferase domain-containing protein [Pseudomonadota bacterium]